MRTHFLNQLGLSGRDTALAVEPQFDFYRAKRVLKLELEFSSEPDEFPSLRLSLEYQAASGRYVLGILFEGVRELVLPAMNPMLFLPELEIEDVRQRGMEGIGFEIVSHFERAFRCSCANVSIISFESA